MLIRLLFIARRRWPILVLVPLVACLAGAAFTPRGGAAPRATYSASGFVAVVGAMDTFEVQQAILSLQQGGLRDAALAELDPAAREATVKGKLDDKTLVVKITATATTPEAAADAAKQFTDVFVSDGNGGRAEAQLTAVARAQDDVTAARKAYDDFVAANAAALTQTPVPPELAAEADDLQADVDVALSLLQEARANQDPTDSYQVVNVSAATRDEVSKLRLPADTPLRVTLAFFMGLLGAIALVAFLEKLNPRIDDADHAERIIGAPVWAMVPVMGRRHRSAVRRVDPETFGGPFAESFRALRSYVDFKAAAEERQLPIRVMVVSASPGEGKTTTAAFLSLCFAESDQDVMVVGGDLRRPSIHQLFDVPRSPGLSSLLPHDRDPEAMSRVVRTDPVTGVRVVPSGPAVQRLAGLLPQFGAITEAARRAGSVVIVDSAPVMVANDPIDMLPAVDWVIVVVRMGRSPERSVKRMMSALRLADAHVAGCVMIGSIESADAKRYAYGYEEPDDSPAPPPPAPPAPTPTNAPASGSIEELA